MPQPNGKEQLFDPLKPKKEDPPPAADELPEKYKGKTPAELAKMLEAKEKENEEMNKGLDQRLADLTKLLTEPASAPAAEVETEKVPDPRIDPEGYYQHLHRKNVEPLAQEAFERFADYERDKARGKFKDYGRFEKEIDVEVAKLPQQLKARKGSFEMAYRLVKSRHLEEIEKELESRGASGFSETPSSPARKEPQAKVELSDKEAEVAKRFNLTPDEYRAWAKVNELPPKV